MNTDFVSKDNMLRLRQYKVGFHDTEIFKKDLWNVVEMEILREE